MDIHIVYDLNLIAIYAAIVSTIALGWQVFTWWRTGPRLRVDVYTDRMLIGGGEPDDGSKYLLISIVNVGNADTTLTHVCLYRYRNRWRWVRKKHETTAMLLNPRPGEPALPMVLKPGHKFMQLTSQEEKIEDWSRSMRCAIAITHSSSRREVFVRLPPISG